jgi:DDE superfamily endonuclease
VDCLARPSVCPKKGARDRLIRLLQSHPAWALGFEDETWWSRTARPKLGAWAADGQPLRLIEQTVAADDPDPQALACYGLLVRMTDQPEQVWLRFVDGRPLSGVTIPFLDWCCAKLAAQGKAVLLLVWDNAGWHISHVVRQWIRAHNHGVKHSRRGVRILSCYLPSRSPWLNPIEPRWIHTQRKIVEPSRLLTARELEDRVCEALHCPLEDHLTISENVA